MHLHRSSCVLHSRKTSEEYAAQGEYHYLQFDDQRLREGSRVEASGGAVIHNGGFIAAF